MLKLISIRVFAPLRHRRDGDDPVMDKLIDH
jgi:hypothetical protein